jgi:uncharacterized protein
MVERSLSSIAFSNEWGRQMRFITGPRQCGKTTLAKRQLKLSGVSSLYYLWDLRAVRTRYKENELFFLQDLPAEGSKSWVCFDEIHKMPKWKNILKGLFDASEERCRFIVTGSAKLSVSKRAGDSLAGRYFTFQLFPFILKELNSARSNEISPYQVAETWITEILSNAPAAEDTLETLLRFSGFPEPYLKQSEAFRRQWERDYLDVVVKEDIGAMTRIVQGENLFDLYGLLTDYIGSPLSIASLSGQMEISQPTIKNYLKRLEDFYLLFLLRPYSKNIKRSLLKSPKLYLYNWAIIKNPAAQFENYVAAELWCRIAYWSMQTGADYRLFYVRDKDKRETDFLITFEGKPWLLIEAKLSPGALDKHHFIHRQELGNIPIVQICRQSGIAEKRMNAAYQISANRFFA